MIRRLPEGPEYFPPDHFTDQPARFLAAELIREKILLATRQEVPHSVTVLIEKWEELPRLIRIYATILVERDGQKAIVIGSKGSMLKQIGTLAREEMEALFDTHIFLDLHVKVETGMARKSRVSQYRRLAYNEPEEMKLKRLFLSARPVSHFSHAARSPPASPFPTISCPTRSGRSSPPTRS